MQHRKTRARPTLRREDGAVAFPTFDAVDVDGTAVAFPALLKRRVTLVGVSFRAIGAAQSREWLEPFGRRVYLTYRGMAHTATAHCSLIEQPVFRFTWLRNWLLRDLRKAATDISLNTWNCLKIGDVAPIRQELGPTSLGGLVSVGSGGARASAAPASTGRIAAPLPGHG